MIFVPQNKLKSGMKLALDIELNYKKRSKAFLIKRGTILSEDSINKLLKFNISGVYIEDGRVDGILDYELRKESVQAIMRIFDICENSHKILDEKTVEEVEKVSERLVSNINRNKKYTIGIFDLQTYDENTYLHSLSVAVISIAIGTELRLNRKKLCDLGVCAMLHDIGKIEIPIELISKPSKLTKSEYDIVKTHASLGGRYVVGNKEINSDIYLGIISHHEKYDGLGYPNGLKEESIPLFGRIISVADVYDALTANRPYRKPVKPFEAIEYIMGGVGTSFDLNIVKAFLRKIEPYPINARVKLSDGRCGVIIKPNIDTPLRPKLKINEEILDLNSDPNSKNIVIVDIDYDYLINEQ